MIKPMTDEEAKRAIEKAKANRFNEYGDYGENNGPVGKTKEEPEMVVFSNGNKSWFLNGKLHREDGPAIDSLNGYKAWWLNSKRHREDGPAIERPDGSKSWYLNGEKVTEEEVMNTKEVNYAEFVESMIITDGKDRLVENTLGLVGEAGEVAEKIKKIVRDGNTDQEAYGMLEAIQKELGDVVFYWYAMHGALGLDPEETIKMNMEKLSSRKERGVIRGSGDNR